MADPEAIARLSGYSWDEIDAHTDQAQTAALAEGYTNNEIDHHLGFDPDTVQARAQDLYNTSALTNPLAISKIDARKTYAELLYGNEVRGAGSFALALGDAAMSGSGASGSHLEEVTTQMGELAAGLPSRRELIDASLELSTGEDFDTVRENLIAHWYETGQRPGPAARMAGQDSELRDKLTAAPRGVAGEFYQAAMRGAGDIYYGIKNWGGTVWGATGLLPNDLLKSKEADLKKSVTDFMDAHAPSRNDWTGWGANLLGEGGLQLAAGAAVGIPAAIAYGITHGADAAWRETKDLGAAAMGATVGALEMGLPVAVLHSPAGKNLIARAVGDAVKIGAIGGLSRTLDPLPEWIATGRYNTPSAEDVGMSALGGAVLGGLGGALSHGLQRAANPRTSMMMEDGTIRTVDVPKPGQPNPFPIDEARHAEATHLAEGSKLPVPPPRQGLLTAIKDEKTGEVFRGLPGEIHPDIYDRVEHDHPEMKNWVGDSGFVGPDGKFLTREEALATLPKRLEGEMGNSPHINFPGEMGGQLDALEYKARQKTGEIPPTIEGESEAEPPLASGYRAGSGIKDMFDRFIPESFKKLLKDEAGTLNLPRGDDPWQKVADGLLRVTANLKDDYRNGVEARLEPYYKVMEPAFREYEALRKAGDKDGMLDSAIGRLKRVMDGEPGVSLDPNHDFSGFMEAGRAQTQLARDWIAHGVRESGREPINLRKEYYPHMWRDDEAPDSFYGSRLHARSIERWSEGIRRGMEDRFHHPIENLIFNTGNSIGWGMRVALEKQLTDQGFIRWYAERPGGENIPVRGMTKRAPSEELDTHAEDAGKVELIRGSQTLQAYTNPDIARLLNNWNDNFRNIPLDRPWVETVRRVANTLKSINLIGGLYHAWTIAQAGWATGLSVLASDAARLNATTPRSLLNAAMAPVHLELQGRELTKQMSEMGQLSPEGLSRWLALDPELSMIVGGGFRPGSRQNVYRPGQATGIIQAMSRGVYTREFRDQFDGKSWYQVPGIAASELARVATSVSAPLFDHAIPYMKAGAVVEQVRAYLRQNPTASQEDRMVAARKIVDNVDDRMGELNQNNIFWPRWGRTIASTAMISMSWTYGTVRQTAAALGWRMRSGGGGMTFELNPAAMLNLASTFVASAGINAIYQYVKTGQLPGENADYFTPAPWAIGKDLLAPRSGGYTKSGQEARILLPGEQKEFYDWAKIVAETNARYNAPHGGLGAAIAAATSGAAHYAEGKMPSYMRVMQTLATGIDPIGHQVAYTPQGLQGYLLEALMPLMVSSASKTRPRSNISWEEAVIGIREMPSWVSEPIRFNAVQRDLVERGWRDELRRFHHEQAALRP